jgi:hypothetical protein
MSRRTIIAGTEMTHGDALAYLRANRAVLERDERLLVRDIAELNCRLQATRQRVVEVDHGIDILEDRPC